MTKAEVGIEIKRYANAFGFEVVEENTVCGLPEMKSQEVNFTWKIDSDYDYDNRKVDSEVKINVAVRKMGGNPTVEELLKTADEIDRAARLMKVINDSKFSYTEIY